MEDAVDLDTVVKALAEVFMDAAMADTVTVMVDTADTTAVSITSQCHIRASPTMVNSTALILVLGITVAIQVMALLMTVATTQEPMMAATVDTVATVVAMVALLEATVAVTVAMVAVTAVVTLASVVTLQEDMEVTVVPSVAATVAMAPQDSQADMYTTDIPVVTTCQALSDTHPAQELLITRSTLATLLPNLD